MNTITSYQKPTKQDLLRIHKELCAMQRYFDTIQRDLTNSEINIENCILDAQLGLESCIEFYIDDLT